MLSINIFEKFSHCNLIKHSQNKNRCINHYVFNCSQSPERFDIYLCELIKELAFGGQHKESAICAVSVISNIIVALYPVSIAINYWDWKIQYNKLFPWIKCISVYFNPCPLTTILSIFCKWNMSPPPYVYNISSIILIPYTIRNKSINYSLFISNKKSRA